jgi:hypothetical protein
MKKVLLLATAALLVTAVTFAEKKKCAKGKTCCSKEKATAEKKACCSKDKAATAKM